MSSLIFNKCGCLEEIKIYIDIAVTAMRTKISLNTKEKELVHFLLVFSDFMCTAETWTVLARDCKKIVYCTYLGQLIAPVSLC